MRFLIVVGLVALSILAVNAAPLEERNGEEGELSGPGRDDQVDGDAALSRHRRSNRRRPVRPVSSSSSSSSSEERGRHRGGRMQHAQSARRAQANKGRKLGGRQFYAAAPIAYPYPQPMMAPMYGK